MKSFYLLPKRDLDQISNILSSSFDLWANEWLSVDAIKPVITVFNAYDKQEHQSDEYCKYESKIGNVYINQNYSLNEFFRKLIFNNERFSSLPSDNSTNAIIPDLISTSLRDYFNSSFSCGNGLFVDVDNDELMSTFARGNSGVFVVFSYEDFQATILLSKDIYKSVVSDRKFTKQSSMLNKIDVSKFKQEILASVLLNKTKLNIKDLMELEVGDFLVLDHKQNELLNVVNEKNVITQCRIGENGNYKSISITN